jgi:DNA-binding PadR family transcriptional regulator
VRVPPSEQLILGLLAERGESYGLELVTASGNRVKRGGVYVTLGRMEQKGLVESSSVEGGRRLYRITALGERGLMASRFMAGEIRLREV